MAGGHLIGTSAAVRPSHLRAFQRFPIEVMTVLHVDGTLEDQMCSFTSDFDRSRAGYSPDRVGALVWAVRTFIRSAYRLTDQKIPKLESADDFVRSILCEDSDMIDHCLWEARRNPSTFANVLQKLATAAVPSNPCRRAFHSAWRSQGLFWIRDASIDPILPAALANLSPGYQGPPTELYRGDRWSNYENKTLGPPLGFPLLECLRAD